MNNTATDAFKVASSISASDLGDVIVVSLFGLLLIVVAYIVIQQYKEIENGGNLKGFSKTIIRAVFVVVICSIFLI